MKACIACAEEIKEEAALCRHRGTKQNSFDSQSVKTSNKNESKSPKSVLILGTVAAIAVSIGLAAFLLLPGDTEAEPAPPEDSTSQPTETQDDTGNSRTQTEPEASEAAVEQEEPEEKTEATTEVTAMLSAFELMDKSMAELEADSPDVYWEADFGDESGLSIGLFLDNYADGTFGGCAIWWYENVEDANTAIDTGWVNFFSDFWNQWVFDNGASVVIIAEEPTHSCYLDSTRVLDLVP